MVKFPDDTYRLLVQGVARAEITEFTSEEPFLRGRVRVLEETGDLGSVETLALMRNVAQQFASLVSESPRLSDELQVLAANIDDPSKLADLAGSNLDFDVAGKQELIEELDVPRRLRRVLDQIAREHDAVKVESEIREKVQSDIGKSQRDYVLRQQLEAIRQELGEAEDGESEVAAPRAAHRGRRHARGGREAGAARARAAGADADRRRRALGDPHLSRVDGGAALVEALRRTGSTSRRRAASSTRITTASRRSRTASSSTSRCSRSSAT